MWNPVTKGPWIIRAQSSENKTLADKWTVVCALLLSPFPQPLANVFMSANNSRDGTIQRQDKNFYKTLKCKGYWFFVWTLIQYWCQVTRLLRFISNLSILTKFPLIYANIIKERFVFLFNWWTLNSKNYYTDFKSFTFKEITLSKINIYFISALNLKCHPGTLIYKY